MQSQSTGTTGWTGAKDHDIVGIHTGGGGLIATFAGESAKVPVALLIPEHPPPGVFLPTRVSLSPLRGDAMDRIPLVDGACPFVRHGNLKPLDGKHRRAGELRSRYTIGEEIDAQGGLVLPSWYDAIRIPYCR